MTFAREGIDLNLTQHMVNLEQGEFRSTFLNQYSWSRGTLYLHISITILIFYLIKLRSLEKRSLEHKSGILKIGMLSVLSYLVFEKTYFIMTSILAWIYTLLRIENEYLILSMNILFGLLSIIILKLIHNQVTKNKIHSKKNIYILLVVGIFLILLAFVNNSYLVVEYIDRTEMGFSNYKFLFQFSWSKSLNYLVRFLGVTYFIWKIYSERKTVANNGYN
jgi:hypothetical protein